MRSIPPGSSSSNTSLPSGPAWRGLPDWGLAGSCRQAVLWCSPWLPQHFTCVVGLLLFRLIRTIHWLQIGSRHPAPFILHLAEPPACKESSCGQEQRVFWGHHGDTSTRSVPAGVGAGTHSVPWVEGMGPGLVSVYIVQPGNLASLPCFLPGRKPHRLRHVRRLHGFLGLPHTLPSQTQPSCGSM